MAGDGGVSVGREVLEVVVIRISIFFVFIV